MSRIHKRTNVVVVVIRRSCLGGCEFKRHEHREALEGTWPRSLPPAITELLTNPISIKPLSISSLPMVILPVPKHRTILPANIIYCGKTSPSIRTRLLSRQCEQHLETEFESFSGYLLQPRTKSGGFWPTSSTTKNMILLAPHIYVKSQPTWIEPAPQNDE